MSLSFGDELKQRIRSGYQILLVPTTEEARVESEILAAATDLKYDMASWDEIKGLPGYAPDGKPKNFVNAVEALDYIVTPAKGTNPNTIFVFKDIHNQCNPNPGNTGLRRALRGLHARNMLNNSKMRRPIVLLQPTAQLHPDLASVVTVLDFSLPDEANLLLTFRGIVESIKDAEKKKDLTPDLQFRVIQGLRGLTSQEAADCLALCIVRHGGVTTNIIETIEEVKANILKKSDMLTYTPRHAVPPISELGGYEMLTRFAEQRGLAYTQAATEIKLDPPKGVVLFGIPGVGKSMAAMAIATTLGLPLLQFDFNAVFGPLLGTSEARIREVTRTVSAIGGCVLVIDEADKSLGGSGDSTGDNNVSRRVLGTLLQWLANKKDKTFVIMTMNRVTGLPPELLRTGRFDRMFYVDLPTDKERRTILEIHMRKREVDPSVYSEADWKEFVTATDNFVGAELEEVVTSARFMAFQAADVRRQVNAVAAARGAAKEALGQALSAKYSVEQQSAAVDLTSDQYDKYLLGIPSKDDILSAAKEVSQTILMKVNSAEIESIRTFGKERAAPVSLERQLERNAENTERERGPRRRGRTVDLDG